MIPAEQGGKRYSTLSEILTLRHFRKSSLKASFLGKESGSSLIRIYATLDYTLAILFRVDQLKYLAKKKKKSCSFFFG